MKILKILALNTLLGLFIYMVMHMTGELIFIPLLQQFFFSSCGLLLGIFVKIFLGVAIKVKYCIFSPVIAYVVAFFMVDDGWFGMYVILLILNSIALGLGFFVATKVKINLH